MTFYRRNLPHLQRDAKPHFVTFVTKHRCVLPDWARDIVLGCCLHDHRTKYDLHAAVIMPDHIHIIFTPRIDQRRQLVVSLAEIMQGIKGSSAHAITRRFGHVLRSSESLDQKIAYVLENPVRRGLARRWQTYPWLWHHLT
jgi:putative transposase